MNSTEATSDSISVALEPLGDLASQGLRQLKSAGVIVVGRSSSSQFRLPNDDKRHSRLHFLVEFNPPHCRVLDLGSRNGTLVNGQRVFTAELQDGDVIQAGSSTFRIRLSGSRILSEPIVPPGLAAADDESNDDFAFHTLDQEREKKLAERKIKSSSNGVKKVKAKAIEKVEEDDEDDSDFEALPSETSVQRAKRAKQPDAKEFDIDMLLAGDSVSPDASDSNLSTDPVFTGPPEIPGYELVRSVDQGPIGEVYQARRVRDGEIFAIKVLRTAKAGDPSAVESFMKEMNPLKELEHPNLVKYHEFGTARGCVYIVSDFVEGIDANKLVKNDGALGVGRVAKLGCQALMALDYAHNLNHVHRDIKPSNLLITVKENRELCLISDYGLARTYQNSALFGVKMKTDLEQSVRFMAPEQFMNFKEMPASVDLYSMAACLYYMLSASNIQDFQTLSFDQSVTKIKRDDAVPLSRRRMNVPPELANLIHYGLNRFTAKRIASAAVFRRELYKFIK